MASREFHLEAQPLERRAIEHCMKEGGERLREHDLMASIRVQELLKETSRTEK